MITFILGTRPEVLKLGPVIARIPEAERCVIWTGQHYSPSLTTNLMDEVGGSGGRVVPTPTALHDRPDDFERLSVMLNDMGRMLRRYQPRRVVVQGDTTSALAGALAAAKLGIPVYHVEAGSRSGDRAQPEELNRQLIDRIAEGHACAYPQDSVNLHAEGIRDRGISGDTLRDSLMDWQQNLPVDLQDAQAAPGDEVLATIHRAETLHNREALSGIMDFLGDLAASRPVSLLAHPHLAQCLQSHDLAPEARGVSVEEPLAPSAFRARLARCNAFVTDSGGAATEAAWFGVPCIVARKVTELRDLERCGRLVVGGRTRESLHAAWGAAKRDAPLSSDVEVAWRVGMPERASEIIARELVG